MAKNTYYSSIIKHNSKSYTGWDTLWESNYWSLSIADTFLQKELMKRPGCIGMVNRKTPKGSFREQRLYANHSGIIERIH